ncbi:MAG: hypothetical protein Q9210_001797, partial [Variospora velana]
MSGTGPLLAPEIPSIRNALYPEIENTVLEPSKIDDSKSGARVLERTLKTYQVETEETFKIIFQCISLQLGSTEFIGQYLDSAKISGRLRAKFRGWSQGIVKRGDRGKKEPISRLDDVETVQAAICIKLGTIEESLPTCTGNDLRQKSRDDLDQVHQELRAIRTRIGEINEELAPLRKAVEVLQQQQQVDQRHEEQEQDARSLASTATREDRSSTTADTINGEY